MNTGHWYNGITSVSKTENRGSIPRWSAVLLLVLALFVGCASDTSTPQYCGLEGVDHMQYPAVVIIEFDRDESLCDCGGIGNVSLGNSVIQCPFHKTPDSFGVEGEPSSLSDTPFKSHQVPSE